MMDVSWRLILVKMMSEDIKKRIMYLSGEDFYLFCYSLFVILDSFECTQGKYFKDYRKLSFLIEFSKDEKLNFILLDFQDKSLSAIDKEYLFNSYSNGLARRSEILKILFTLEKKKFVSLSRDGDSNHINVTLIKENIPTDFFQNSIFDYEYKNISNFKKAIKRVSSLKLETMLEKIYTDNGIKTWAI